MNAKAYKHIEKAYMYAKQAELGFGSDRTYWFVSDSEVSRISIEDAKAFLHSARGSTQPPEQRNVPAFLLVCGAVFSYKSVWFKDYFSSEQNVNRALKAAMLISGMVAEKHRNHNPTHTQVDTFQHAGTYYEYALLRKNLKNLVQHNTHPYDGGERLDEHTANAMALELERELFRLLQSITSEELKQITKEDRHRLKSQSKEIFKSCSYAYWQATVTQQHTTDSIRQTNRVTSASKRQRITNE